MAYEKVKAFLEHYRVWDLKDEELERELAVLVHDADGWESRWADTERRHQELLLAFGEDTLDAADRALTLLTMVKRTLDRHELVSITDKEGLADLTAMTMRYDELEAFRAQVLGVVKKANALDMKAQPDDKRLVALLGALMP